MEIKFTGNYEKLKDTLSSVETEGEWVDLNDNQKQFRHRLGGILNWYPSTGTINFQGKQEIKKEFESLIKKLLGISSDVVLESVKLGGYQKEDEEEKTEEIEISNDFLGHNFTDSELVIGLVGAVGTELSKVIEVLTSRIRAFGYEADTIRISKEVISQINQIDREIDDEDEYTRISSLMDEGDRARELAKDNSILALGAAAKINAGRLIDTEEPPYRKRHAYIISSLKHPEEVSRLREIYSEGFLPIPPKPTICSGHSDHLPERSDAGCEHPTLTGRLESSLTVFFS